MKKRFGFLGIALMVMALVMLLVPGTLFADEPTEVEVKWDGSGLVFGEVISGNDAIANFHSNANTHFGTFTAKDMNNNPYGYGVDTNTFTMESSIFGGGTASLTVKRTDSLQSMYGPAGQISFTSVWTDDGDATLANRSRTNFADMIDSNYGWQSNNHITVSNATNYQLIRSMDGGTGNFAAIVAWGSGNANLTAMSSEAKPSQVRLGWGAGCYTNAKFNASGSGTFNLLAEGNNEATTALVPGLAAESFNIILNWTNGTIDIPNYATTAK